MNDIKKLEIVQKDSSTIQRYNFSVKTLFPKRLTKFIYQITKLGHGFIYSLLHDFTII